MTDDKFYGPPAHDTTHINPAKAQAESDHLAEQLKESISAHALALAENERLRDRLTSMWDDKQKSNVCANAEIERLKGGYNRALDDVLELLSNAMDNCDGKATQVYVYEIIDQINQLKGGDDG